MHFLFAVNNSVNTVHVSKRMINVSTITHVQHANEILICSYDLVNLNALHLPKLPTIGSGSGMVFMTWATPLFGVVWPYYWWARPLFDVFLLFY